MSEKFHSDLPLQEKDIQEIVFEVEAVNVESEKYIDLWREMMELKERLENVKKIIENLKNKGKFSLKYQELEDIANQLKEEMESLEYGKKEQAKKIQTLLDDPRWQKIMFDFSDDSPSKFFN